VSKQIDGSDQYWSTDVEPSRGQYRDIAIVALQLFGIKPPENRLQATIAQVRLRAALNEAEPVRPLPDPW